MSDTIIHVHPTWDSPTSELIYTGDGEDSCEFEFEITNCPSSPYAYSTLIGGNGADWAGVPGVIDGLLLRNISMRPQGVDCWIATCKYGEPKKRQDEKEKLKSVGDYRISFSTKGQTIKQFHAKTTTRYPAEDNPFEDPAPDLKGAINVQADGSIDGVDVILPSLVITVTQRMAGASLNPAYMLAVAQLNGKYNDTDFMGFPAYTLQFTGGDGSLSFAIPNPLPGEHEPLPPQDRELSFEFVFSPNITDMTIGSITGINKRGHQYMWILWKDAVDSSSQTRFRTPRGVYVQDLYGIEPADFSILGLGV